MEGNGNDEEQEQRKRGRPFRIIYEFEDQATTRNSVLLGRQPNGKGKGKDYNTVVT